MRQKKGLIIVLMKKDWIWRKIRNSFRKTQRKISIIGGDSNTHTKERSSRQGG